MTSVIGIVIIIFILLLILVFYKSRQIEKMECDIKNIKNDLVELRSVIYK